MIPQLQEYAKEDSGFMQFCNQYEVAAADPQTRKEYFIWYNNRWREAGMYQAATEKGREEGIQIGREENKEEIARNMKAEGIPIETITRLTKLSADKVEEL